MENIHRSLDLKTLKHTPIFLLSRNIISHKPEAQVS